MFPPRHPKGDRTATWFHAGLALYYVLGLWFHAVSTVRHWRGRKDCE
jgi:hypothetical protein